jgi:hypothetical protein
VFYKQPTSAISADPNFVGLDRIADFLLRMHEPRWTRPFFPKRWQSLVLFRERQSGSIQEKFLPQSTHGIKRGHLMMLEYSEQYRASGSAGDAQHATFMDVDAYHHRGISRTRLPIHVKYLGINRRSLAMVTRDRLQGRCQQKRRRAGEFARVLV